MLEANAYIMIVEGLTGEKMGKSACLDFDPSKLLSMVDVLTSLMVKLGFRIRSKHAS